MSDVDKDKIKTCCTKASICILIFQDFRVPIRQPRTQRENIFPGFSHPNPIFHHAVLYIRNVWLMKTCSRVNGLGHSSIASFVWYSRTKPTVYICMSLPFEKWTTGGGWTEWKLKATTTEEENQQECGGVGLNAPWIRIKVNERNHSETFWMRFERSFRPGLKYECTQFGNKSIHMGLRVTCIQVFGHNGRRISYFLRTFREQFASTCIRTYVVNDALYTIVRRILCCLLCFKLIVMRRLESNSFGSSEFSFFK